MLAKLLSPTKVLFKMLFKYHLHVLCVGIPTPLFVGLKTSTKNVNNLFIIK